MVNLRSQNLDSNGQDDSETPDLRGIIVSEVGETFQQLLLGLFTQIRDELSQLIDQKIIEAFIARN